MLSSSSPGRPSLHGHTTPPPQMLYTHLEAFADRTVSYVIPFYSEGKMAILFWMITSRTLVRPPRPASRSPGARQSSTDSLLPLSSQGARFVYTRLISPTLAAYSTPVDLVLSFTYELAELVRGLVASPFVWLLHRLKPLFDTTPSISQATKEAEGTTLTPRTVVRRAKVVYEEIERLQRMERPGMAKRTKDRQAAEAKKDPRLRERRMVLERQAREREEKELEREVDRMARQQQQQVSLGFADPSPPPSEIRKGAAANHQAGSVSLVNTQLSKPSGPIALAPVPSPLHSRSAHELLDPTPGLRTATTTPKPSLPLPAAASPFNMRPSTPSSSLRTNAVASGSRPPTRSSLRLGNDRSPEPHDTPTATRLGNANQATPLPPGAFLFRPSSTVVSLPIPIAERPASPPSPRPSPPKTPPREPLPSGSPPKRKVASPPKLRATPARKAKSKALLGMTPSSRPPTIELEERIAEDEDEDEEDLASHKRRKKSVVKDTEMVRVEGEEKEQKPDRKGKGRAIKEEDEVVQGQGSESPKAQVEGSHARQDRTEENMASRSSSRRTGPGAVAASKRGPPATAAKATRVRPTPSASNASSASSATLSRVRITGTSSSESGAPASAPSTRPSSRASTRTVEAHPPPTAPPGPVKRTRTAAGVISAASATVSQTEGGAAKARGAQTRTVRSGVVGSGARAGSAAKKTGL